MNINQKILDQEQLVKIIDYFIQNIEVENEIKAFFYEYIEKINNQEELKMFIDFLEKTYINQELVKNEDEYIKEVKKIDNKTEEELVKILN